MTTYLICLPRYTRLGRITTGRGLPFRLRCGRSVQRIQRHRHDLSRAPACHGGLQMALQRNRAYCLVCAQLLLQVLIIPGYCMCWIIWCVNHSSFTILNQLYGSYFTLVTCSVNNGYFIVVTSTCAYWQLVHKSDSKWVARNLMINSTLIHSNCCRQAIKIFEFNIFVQHCLCNFKNIYFLRWHSESRYF